MGDGVTLRDARPDLDDGIVFARYLDTAADGLFRLTLGRPFDRIVAAAYLESGHDLSAEHVVFAECDDAIVGMASAYSASQHRESSDEPLERAAGWRQLRMGIVALLGRRVLRFLDQVPEGDHYLQAIAVDESQRGRGVGSGLIDEVERRARAVGSMRIALDVAVENRDAQRLYERIGMTVEATSPRALFLPESQVHRMVKVL